jgi:hypothetical protein
MIAPITLRVMTTKYEQMVAENAQLEVPVIPTTPNGKVGYVFIAIDVKTGRIDVSQNLGSYTVAEQKLMHDMLPKMPDILPYWDEIYEHSKNTHETGLDLWAVAWDWVITPDGPILLEGNSGFRLGVPQMQYGGLIQMAATPSET